VYSPEVDEDVLALRFERWLNLAFALIRNRTGLAALRSAHKRRELERDLSDPLTASATYDLVRAIQSRMRRAGDLLLTFVAFTGQVEEAHND
jgi:hypothetical protein